MYHLIELLPYCQTLAGEAVTVMARVHNPYPNPIQVELALVLPSGFRTHSIDVFFGSSNLCFP